MFITIEKQYCSLLHECPNCFFSHDPLCKEKHCAKEFYKGVELNLPILPLLERLGVKIEESCFVSEFSPRLQSTRIGLVRECKFDDPESDPISIKYFLRVFSKEIRLPFKVYFYLARKGLNVINTGFYQE